MQCRQPFSMLETLIQEIFIAYTSDKELKMIEYNTLEMSNGTEYRVLVDYQKLVEIVDDALKAGGLLTVPMGMRKPGKPKSINPQHIVALGDYSES
jgi:hypothetical protein